MTKRKRHARPSIKRLKSLKEICGNQKNVQKNFRVLRKIGKILRKILGV